MYFDMVTYKIPIDIRLKTPGGNPIGHDTRCLSVYSHIVCDRRWKSHTRLKNCRLSIRLLYPPPRVCLHLLSVMTLPSPGI